MSVNQGPDNTAPQAPSSAPAQAPLGNDADTYTWHACLVTPPASAYGLGTHLQGMAQPWGRWALRFVPADSRPWAWIGRGPCIVGWGAGAQFRGSLTQASQAYRAWARKTPVFWGTPADFAAGKASLEAPNPPESAHISQAVSDTDPLAPQPVDLQEILWGLGSFPFNCGSGQITVPGIALIGLPYLTTCLLWRSDFAAQATELLAQINHPADQSPSAAPSLPKTGADWQFVGSAVPRPEWLQRLEAGIARLRAGEAEKFVMARDEVWESSRPVRVRDIVARLIAEDDQAGHQVSAWAFSIGNQVGATPEVLARTQNGEFVCRILAGTTLPGRGPELFDDPKEMGEHQVARESVMQALDRAGVREVQAGPPSILSLPNVDHLQSVVTGRVSEQADCATITEVFHPTAAICGTPREAAAQLISELEGMERGDFTGPVGIISPTGDGQWNIALRCAQTCDLESEPDNRPALVKRWRLLAGAGIMPDSVPTQEWDEMGNKMRLMRQALGI